MGNDSSYLFGKIFAVIFISIVLFFAIRMYLRSAGKAKNEKAKENPDEDYFTDQVTGKKFTLEQAEKGIELAETPWPPSDEYIESNYPSKELRELEYVKRELWNKKFSFIDEEEFEIKAQHLFARYSNFIIGNIARKNNSHVMITQGTHQEGRNWIEEFHLTLVLESNSSLGHSLLWPAETRDIVNNRLGGQKNFSPEKKYCIHELEATSSTGTFQKFAEAIDQFPDFTIETIGNHVYLKSNKTVTRPQLTYLLEAEKTLSHILNKKH